MSARRLVSASLANLLIPLSGLVVSPFLSRELGPTGRGLYAALTLPVVVYGWAGTYGLQDSLSVHVHNGRLTKRAAALVCLAVAVPLGLLGIGLLDLIGLGVFAGSSGHYRQFVVLSLLAPVHVLVSMLIGALAGAGDVRGVNLAKVVPTLVRTALLVGGCLALNLSAYGAALLFLVSMVAAVPFGLYRLRADPAPPDAPPVPFGSLLRYALKCLPGVLAAVSSARLDQIIGLPVIGARQLGYYAVAVSVAELPMVIATAARTVLMGRPATTDRRRATVAARLAVTASVLACGLLMLAIPVALPWFFGHAFGPAVVPAMILCAATTLYTGAVILSAVLLVGDRAAWSSTALVLGAGVGVGLLLLLAPLGATGAALASLGGYGIAMVIASWAIHRSGLPYTVRMLTIPYRQDARTAVEWLRGLGQRWPARYRPPPFETTAAAALIVLAWLRILVPDVIQLATTGRPAFNARVAVPASVNAAGDLLSLLFILVAAALVVSGVARRRWYRPHWLAVVLAPLVAIALAGLLDGDGPELVWIALPLAALGIWLRPPERGVLATFGVLAGITAAGSVLLAAVLPRVGLLSGSAAGAKGGLFGGLLAGPYPHSNVLALALALALPFVFDIGRPFPRRACLVMVLAALVWTGARGGQFAAVMVLSAWLVRRRFPGRYRLVSAVIAAGFALVVAVPFVARNPSDFTNRGRIWHALLRQWTHRPILGYGPDFFERQPDLARQLGGDFTHGHNILVQFLVVGGVVTVLLVAALLYLAWREALALGRAGQIGPVLYLVAFAYVSWLEASHVATSLAGYLAWLPLFLVVRLGLAARLPGEGPVDAAAGDTPAAPGAGVPATGTGQKISVSRRKFATRRS
jgi:O-antigen/teichoic acid export membrane protein